MRTQFLVVAGTLASALTVAGCKQEVKAPEPVRPVLSTVLLPTATGSTAAVGTIQPRYETNSGFARWDALSRVQSTSETWLRKANDCSSRSHCPRAGGTVSEGGSFESRGPP